MEQGTASHTAHSVAARRLEYDRADAPYAIRVSRLLGIFLAFLSLAVTALVTAYFNTRVLLAD